MKLSISSGASAANRMTSNTSRPGSSFASLTIFVQSSQTERPFSLRMTVER